MFTFSIDDACAQEIEGLFIKMRTEHEDLDPGSRVYATVKVDGEVVAERVLVATGLIKANTQHPPVQIRFDSPVSENAKYSIELSRDLDADTQLPWTMTFSVNAIQTDKKQRATDLRMETSDRYSTNDRIHLLFWNASKSGEMPFYVL